jgi:UDP-glucose 4-epimerase
VLVTGGCGFIGSHVAERFSAEGFQVLTLDIESGTEAGVPCGRPAHSVASRLVADVASPQAAREVVRFRPDLVVHAAAQTRTGRSITDPVGDALTNIVGTLRMLEAARSAGTRAFIFISSAAIYGDPPMLPLTEDAPHRPLSPYGVSKLAATNYVSCYRQAGFVPALSLIPANVYGPGQQAGEDGAVVPGFMRQALRGESMTIEGDGSQTRDFVYVEDLVEAVCLAWRWLGDGGGRAAGAPVAFNIGTGRETSISRLADLVEKTIGRQLGRTYRPARSGDISRSSLSPRLAARHLGWRPGVGLEEGLRRTYEWWAASTSSTSGSPERA